MERAGGFPALTLVSGVLAPHSIVMSKRNAALAGAIGSAAIAAAWLYASRRKERQKKTEQLGPIPSGEPPETD